MRTPSTLPQLGDVIDDRYELISELGVGGFGAVYLGRQRSTGQQVAIKLLRDDRFAADELVQAEKRLERELKLVGQLSHPHIVRLIDGGRLPGGQLYLALEYVAGEELAEVLAEQGPLAEADCVHLMTQVLDALCAAHARGIVHRDLKPQNIMITRSGARPNATVLDFGISGVLHSARGEDFSNLTATGQVLGTPNYMAPEQLHSAATVQTDVYAWGLICLECLTGERVVQATSPVQAITWQISDAPVPIPEAIRARPLGAVLARATAKSTAQRYATADVALADLVAVTTGASPAVSPPPPSTDAVGAGAGADAATGPYTPTVAVATGPTLQRQPTQVADPGGPLPARQSSPEPVRRSDALRDTAIVAEAPAARKGRTLLIGVVATLVLASLVMAVVLGTRGGCAASKQPTLRVDVSLETKVGTDVSRVWGLALSPNSKQLAAGGNGGKVELWTPGASKRTARYDGAAFTVSDLAYSPDGRWLAGATFVMSKIRLWNRATGKHVDFGASKEPIKTVAFSPDSRKIVFAPGHHPIEVVDVKSRQGLVQLKGHLYPISAVAVSPDGKQVAAAGWGKTVHLWSLSSGKHLHGLRGHTGEIKALAFSGDSKRLASAGADGSVRLWNPRTGKGLSVLQKNGAAVWGLAMHPTQPLLVSGGEDRRLTFWDIRAAKRIRQVDHTDPVGKLVFGPKGKRLASASWTGLVRLWNVRFP